MMEKSLIFPIDDKYQSYLSDESHFTGFAESISFPKNEDEIKKIIEEIGRQGKKITIQGGKTGIAGCAVPLGGHILNLSFMNQVKSFETSGDGLYLLKVEPGITLLDLSREIKKLGTKEELFWPPDPTETSATVGGTASCNARGICAQLYGGTREYIHAIRVVNAEGVSKDIIRSKSSKDTVSKDSVINKDIPNDLIDVYLAGEGMFGVITELTLRLVPKPKVMWGICFFFSSETDSFKFADSLVQYVPEAGSARMAAAEFLDRRTIDLIEERKPNISSIRELPDAAPDMEALIYVEIHGADDTSVETCAEALLLMAEECHVASDATWAVSGEYEVDKLRAFRHTAAESVNLFIEKAGHTYPGVYKLGMDRGFEGQRLETVVLHLREQLAENGLKGCIFGHIFDNHLHLNMLPDDLEQFEKGRSLMEELSAEDVENGGTKNREHGVGKLKKRIFLRCVPEENIFAVKLIKRKLDPTGFWNPGNMLDDF